MSLESFFQNSRYHMANISQKTPSFRQALAMGKIATGKGFQHIKNQSLPKGDVLKLAEIAGINGAKNAWQNIPMCHPLLLDFAAVSLELEPKTKSVVVYATVSTTAKTGVEMEALAAVNAALLTVYDLTKPVEPELEIYGVKLLMKLGGKKGLWCCKKLPENIKKLLPKPQMPFEGISVDIITLSDRASQKKYEDKSGKWLKTNLKNLGCVIKKTLLIPDDAKRLSDQLQKRAGKVDVIITTGGTGLSPRDITVDVVESLIEKKIDGIGEVLRLYGANYIVTSWLSRAVAGVLNRTLIITLPGSTGGVKDGIEVLKPLLKHGIDHIQGKVVH